MNEEIAELKRLHLLSKPEMKRVLVNIENILKEKDGKKALFAIYHLRDAIVSRDQVEDALFTEIDSLITTIEPLQTKMKVDEAFAKVVLAERKLAWHQIEQKDLQIESQKEALKGAADISTIAGARIKELETQVESQKELIKRTVPDMSELSNADYKTLKNLWIMNGSSFLISVLRHLDALDNIPDIFSHERFSPNTFQEGDK